MKVSIILPTYNEIENIAYLVRAIDLVVKDDKEIIVVDDNSPDGTSQAVERLINKKEINNLRLITRIHNKGLTNSIKEGINNARGEIVVWLDCDFSMPPEVIPKLIAEIDNGYDVAVGSRFVKGGSFKRETSGSEDSWVAVLLSRMMNMFIRIVLGFSFKDYTSGFIAIKKDILNRIELRGDYGEYFIDLIFRVLMLNYKVVEIPYICLPRRKGSSKTGGNLIDYAKRGRKYIYTTFKLLGIKIKHKLFRVIDA